MGSLEHMRDRNDEAMRYYTRSLHMLHALRDPVNADIAAVESNLGALHFEAARYEPAADFFQQSVREIENALGPRHPSLVRSLVNLAMCLDRGGNPGQAESVSRRAVALSGKVFGQEHPLTATAMLGQARALRQLRCKAQARDLEKRAKAALRMNSRAISPAIRSVLDKCKPRGAE